jgi:hypothetical protein
MASLTNDEIHRGIEAGEAAVPKFLQTIPLEEKNALSILPVIALSPEAEGPAAPPPRTDLL